MRSASADNLSHLFFLAQRGIPIYVYKISSLTPATLKRLIPSDDASSSSIAVITLALIRFLLPFTSALSREHQETPVSGTNSIVDVGGVGLSRYVSCLSLVALPSA